eukprot:jgi/Undpi1/6851/HiC_scaffold_21.g09327.m1
MDFSSATTFENMEEYLSVSTILEEGVSVPVLERFVIARGQQCTAADLTLNQVLITCAAATEAGSADVRPNLGRILLASQGAAGAGNPGPHMERNAKRAMVQAAGSYLWGCPDNGGLRSVGGCVVFPSAMPAPPYASSSSAPATDSDPLQLATPDPLQPALPNFEIQPTPPNIENTHLDKRARTTESEYECESTAAEPTATPAGKTSEEEPPLTAITGKVQFTAKFTALLHHTHAYDKATMRDINSIASSIEELVPMLTQLIELCRQHPAKLKRELTTVSTLLAGVNKCIALKQPVRAALFIYQETHQKMVGATSVDHTALDLALKNLKKLGGQSVVAEFPGWNRGLGGGGRTYGYRTPRSQPTTTGRFSAGRGHYYSPPPLAGRGSAGTGHYTPPRRGGGRMQGGRGRGQMGRGVAAGSPGRRAICGRCDAQGLNADHSHSTCPQGIRTEDKEAGTNAEA